MLVGFALLLLGGELLVRGGVGMALKLEVPKVIIGLTLVAFATSAPELIVSLIAAAQGKSDIALGNVIGSNIANVGLILGATALIFKMEAVQLTYRKDWIFLIVANVVLGALLLLGGIPRLGGLVLVALLIGYNFQKIRSARNSRKNSVGEEIDVAPMAVWKAMLLIFMGSAALYFGAKFFVAGIADMAIAFGWSERLISITLVAFGTSVPELAASIMAARKGESDIAIGNVIGSNIFNILSVLGITSLIHPIKLIDEKLLQVDFLVSVVLTLVLIPLMGLFKSDRLDRKEGGMLLFLYVAYVFYLLI